MNGDGQPPDKKMKALGHHRLPSGKFNEADEEEYDSALE